MTDITPKIVSNNATNAVDRPRPGYLGRLGYWNRPGLVARSGIRPGRPYYHGAYDASHRG